MINQNQFTEDLNHIIEALEDHPLYNENYFLKKYESKDLNSVIK